MIFFDLFGLILALIVLMTTRNAGLPQPFTLEVRDSRYLLDPLWRASQALATARRTTALCAALFAVAMLGAFGNAILAGIPTLFALYLSVCAVIEFSIFEVHFALAGFHRIRWASMLVRSLAIGWAKLLHLKEFRIKR
jgi:hypothetical protein